MKGKYWLIVIILFILVDSIFYVVYFKEHPPVNEIAEARVAIKEAEKIHSKKYSEFLFNQAKSYYDSAMAEWKAQNEKLFVLRNYDKVKSFAVNAKEIARMASEDTQSESQNLYHILNKQLTFLDKKVKYFERNFKRLPTNESYLTDWNKGIILLNEGKMAFDNEEYLHSFEKTESAKEHLLSAIEQNEQLLEDYFQSFPQWNNWVKEAIKNSKKNKIDVLIVDKFSKKCTLYRKGKIHDSYEVELGKNWIGDKNYQGDKSTPEGHYKIIRKLSSAETRYHKALLLNYPNEEDEKRFIEKKANGELDKNAKIGGYIEIHGHGGKGINWTDGCIALENEDMDKLYSLSKIDMNVIIVGSLKPLDKVIQLNQ